MDQPITLGFALVSLFLAVGGAFGLVIIVWVFTSFVRGMSK